MMMMMDRDNKYDCKHTESLYTKQVDDTKYRNIKEASAADRSVEHDREMALHLHHQLNGNMLAPFAHHTLDIQPQTRTSESNRDMVNIGRCRRVYVMSGYVEGAVFMASILSFVGVMALVLGLTLNGCSTWSNELCSGLWVGLISVIMLAGLLMYCHINGPSWPGVCCRMYCPVRVVDKLLGDDPDANSATYLPRLPQQDVPCCPNSCPCCYRIQLVSNLNQLTN